MARVNLMKIQESLNSMMVLIMFLILKYYKSINFYIAYLFDFTTNIFIKSLSF